MGDAIWVLVVDITSKEVVHSCTVQALSLRYRAVLMGKKQRLEIHNLFTQLRYRGGEGVVLCAEKLHLGLQICKPLLLALAALEGSDSDCLSTTGKPCIMKM